MIMSFSVGDMFVGMKVVALIFSLGGFPLLWTCPPEGLVVDNVLVRWPGLWQPSMKGLFLIRLGKCVCHHCTPSPQAGI